MGLAQDVLVVAGLAGVAIAGLFFIIRGAGQALGDFELPQIKLPDINIGLPSLGGISLPSFELPSFELPSFTDIFPEPSEPSGLDFTDVGAAAARARQDGAGVIPSDLVSVTREPLILQKKPKQGFKNVLLYLQRHYQMLRLVQV